MAAPEIQALDHLVLTVVDIEATLAFYTRVLGMRAETFGEGRRALHFGTQKINLHPAQAPYTPRAARPAPGSADLCFLVAGPLEDWVAYLTAVGASVEEGPVARTGATGPLRSLYLRDPDGNLLELSVPG